MTTATPIQRQARRRHTRRAPTQQPTGADEELRALWAMTAAQRVAAMWRGQLTRRQLSKWTSRAPIRSPAARRRVRMDRDAHTGMGRTEPPSPRRRRGEES